MLFDLVWWAEQDVSSSTGGFPAGCCSREEMFVGVGNPAIVLLLEFILRRSRGGIAAQPELLDELFALLVGSELLISGCFFLRDDVDHVLGQPKPEWGLAGIRRDRDPYRSIVQA